MIFTDELIHYAELSNEEREKLEAAFDVIDEIIRVTNETDYTEFVCNDGDEILLTELRDVSNMLISLCDVEIIR